MDEDIDIEEHDLLENPAIKRIFPDLSILKKEISLYGDEVTGIKQDPDVSKLTEADEDICSTVENNDLESDIVFVEKRLPPVYGNKIILGSKPAQFKVEMESENITDKIYSSVIKLKDISLYLEKSKRFCSICHILFPHIESFKIHHVKCHHKNEENFKNIVEPLFYECDKCSRKFSRHGNLIKHYRKFHRHISKKRVFSTRKSKGIVKPRIVESGSDNRCFHCEKNFSSKKSLIEHIYTVLRTNTKMDKTNSKVLSYSLRNKMQLKATNSFRLVSKLNKHNGNKFNTSSSKGEPVSLLVYRCLYCSYNFRHIKYYKKHIENKHSDLDATQVKIVPFDGHCKYCSVKSSNWRSYNSHLVMFHKEKVNNIFKINPKVVIPKLNDYLTNKLDSHKTVQGKVMRSSNIADKDEMDVHRNKNPNKDIYVKNSFVPKTVLYKCKRCDIHFLTAKITMNHQDHMEMLINWKCNLCQRIFKKDDEFAHGKQHLIPCKFTIVELDACELERVLYKCSKCAIHFYEENYFSHFGTCEDILAESTYCKICDFLIDKHTAGHHHKSHRLKKFKAGDFTIINTDIITLKKIENDIILKRIEDDISIPEIENDNITIYSSSADNIKKHKPEKPISKLQATYKKMYLKLGYCETCKSFVTKLIRRVHFEKRCAHMRTIVCKYCGLVFTPSSIKGHKRLHQESTDLKLQDFTFYAMKNGKMILPPVPQYPKCHKCDVHFTSKVAILDHICSDHDFLTCHFCNIKLSEPVFKLHMSFHYYSKAKGNNFQSIILNAKEPKNKDEPTKTKENYRNIRPENRNASQTNYMPSNNKLLFNKTKPCKEMNGPEEIDVAPETITEDNKNANCTETLDPTDNLNSDYELFDILYFCFNCHATINDYDEVVQHCQDHLCGVNIETERCTTCNEIFERKSFNKHSMFHSRTINQKDLKLLTFDTFYFTLGVDIWMEHIFGNLSERNIEAILKRSIYRKCKIKMRVIQDGPPNLTIYKCVSCCVIVDSDHLEKHSETACFRMRKFPCSFCGLPFLSYLARQKHEIIHKTKNISLKSYRIVVFNRESDKNANMVLTKPTRSFYLYQCRNCNGIIDKYQRAIHKCKNNDLKKCASCNLLINSSDFKAHCSKHQKVPMFIQKNMKVVLFGQSDSSLTDVKVNDNNEIVTFDGTYIDFTFYRCVDCEVCFGKSQMAKLNHSVCYIDSKLKARCPKCDLFILKKKMAQHTKLHERYDDFVKENINILPYSVSGLQANFIPANQYNYEDHCVNKEDQQVEPYNAKNKLDNNEKVMNLTEIPADTIMSSEKTAKLLKCICGLHFLDSSSIQEHLGLCNPRIAKQRCLKCNLLFTPNILFDHLLIHHGDKKCTYKFNIIEMSKKKCEIVTLYKCVYCNTHFVDYELAKAHFEICLEVDVDKEKCRTCNLLFDVTSIKLHESDHHTNKVAGVDIIDIKTYLHLQDLHIEGSEIKKPRDNTMSFPVDFVIESKKYNLSENTLSQIDLSKYDNCIYKCEMCNTHFLTECTLKAHFANGHILSPQETCHKCGLRFSLLSLTKHIYIQHEQMNLSSVDLIIKYKYETVAEENCVI